MLEVGVGTGIGFRFYRQEHQVQGIDLSPSMLARARRRGQRSGLRQVRALEIVDAGRLDDRDDCFPIENNIGHTGLREIDRQTIPPRASLRCSVCESIADRRP